MSKNKIIFLLLVSAVMITAAHGQGIVEGHQTKTISGLVTNIDYVGNVISIQSNNGQQMSFSVPSSAVITRDTDDVGLMDIKNGHPVTIQYDVASPGKNFVESIVDNKPTQNADIN